jgi:hypothetical protein
MSSNLPIEAHPAKLAKTGVRMSQVKDQLGALQRQIDQTCHLSACALSVIGEPARIKYNEGCTSASVEVGALMKTAENMAKNLAGNAIGYISSEAANIKAIEKGAQGLPVADSDAVGQGIARFFGLAGTVNYWNNSGMAHSAYSEAEMATLSEATQNSASLDVALEQALETWEAHGQFFLPEGEAVSADGELGSALMEQVSAEDSISAIGRFSQATGSVLRATAGFAPAALAASVFWTANAIVMSDSAINAAINGWRGVAAAARTIFSEWMPAIQTALFKDWHGSASSEAKKNFAKFVASGLAFASQAERMAGSLTSVIEGLNTIYSKAFVFAMIQFGALLAAAVTVWLDPAAALVVQRLALILRSSVTIVVNAILAALGGLLIWIAA